MLIKEFRLTEINAWHRRIDSIAKTYEKKKRMKEQRNGEKERLTPDKSKKTYNSAYFLFIHNDDICIYGLKLCISVLRSFVHICSFVFFALFFCSIMLARHYIHVVACQIITHICMGTMYARIRYIHTHICPHIVSNI